MAFFKFDVIEVKSFTVHYTVEAPNLQEARNKVALGETRHEETIRDHGVQSRDIFEELGEVKDDLLDLLDAMEEEPDPTDQSRATYDRDLDPSRPPVEPEET